MEKTIENASGVEAQEDNIIVLGVASVETKGGGGRPGEDMGLNADIGISEE